MTDKKMPETHLGHHTGPLSHEMSVEDADLWSVLNRMAAAHNKEELEKAENENQTCGVDGSGQGQQEGIETVQSNASPSI